MMVYRQFEQFSLVILMLFFTEPDTLQTPKKELKFVATLPKNLVLLHFILQVTAE